MMKTKIALAILMTTLVLAPASATRSNQAGKPISAKATKAKAVKALKPARAKATKAQPAKPEAAMVAAVTVAAAPAERKSDRWMDSTSQHFLNALWKLDPESAILAGKFDGAAGLTIPNAATRAQRIAFADEWLQRLGKIDARQLSAKQRTDLALVINKVKADRWYLTTLREYEWNPALYNVAQPIDLILTTEYAAKPQRLRTLLKRIANVPAYYLAAQASIVNPTHQHTQLAISQAPGVMTVLADLGQAAQASILTQQEKAIFAQRIANAGSALIGYLDFLTALDLRQQEQRTARSFRIGKDLYEAKFGFDIQSASSADQTYQKALTAREDLLVRMNGLADDVWARTMDGAAKPAERTRKIGMVIDKLSASHVARENFLPEIRRQIGQLQQFVVKNNLLTLDPKRPLEVRETPLYQRGVAGASIDAPGPYRPQDRTFYNVTPLDSLTAQEAEGMLREYNTWILQILNIHEAIPGHYAQLVYANKSPSLLKSLFGNGAMIEGWAVYAERMMLEAGYGDHAPEMWLMYCKWNLRSVTNTLLDYGVHVQGMTQAQAMDLLVRQAFQTPAEAGDKWRRVQLSSVQLTSYFSGYSDIMELREQRRQALGSKFVLKDFHEQLLGYGSAPVKVIKELMQ